MLFPTLDFGLFFLAVLALAWGLNSRPEARKLVLLGASYIFYGYWDWRFCALLLVSSLINFAGARLLHAQDDTGTRKGIAGTTIAANLAILGVFKYYGFFMESLGDLLFSLGIERDLPLLEIVLPVGISFFTFQGISYVVDVYRGQLEKPAPLLDVLLYISFFPQLVAGPIVRASFFLPQLERTPDPKRILAAMGLLLILWGLFKKAIVATYLAVDLVDPVFADPQGHGTLDLMLAAYAYGVQIYCDFSAYSDMAIGLAALLGFRFPRNFDQPYRAASLREFWHRWHISLSTWLRDYLYKPLGGSRGGSFKTYRNLLLTMLLGGIWHGAAWKFVLWGALHGGGLAIERFFGWARAPGEQGRLRRILVTLAVFHFVTLAWIFFRASSLDIALEYLAALGQISEPTLYLTPLTAVLIALGLAMHFMPADTFQRAEQVFARTPALVQGFVFAIAVLLIEAIGLGSAAPFIYFQF